MNKKIDNLNDEKLKLDDCYFYHTYETEKYGIIKGEWDLRDNIHNYLGKTDFKNKRVLEVGTASGYCCFWMEKMGASVTAYDLSPKDSWDVVPYHNLDTKKILESRRKHIKKINNSWWLIHNLIQSTAQKRYGDIYSIPESIGNVDITVLGLVLPHVRDPFLALTKSVQNTSEKVIIVGSPQRKRHKKWIIDKLINKFFQPSMFFWPNSNYQKPWDTWWMMPETITTEFLRILGFGNIKVNYHQQLVNGQVRNLYTIVGRR